MKTLFTTYFTSKTKERQEEIDFCLSSNIKNHNIDLISVFIDSSTNKSHLDNLTGENSKLKVIQIQGPPTYKDWLSTSSEGISIFANADVYLDDSISKASEYLKYPNRIICLSRHEDEPDGITEHKNPHWSQDLWAINFNHKNNLSFIEELNIPTGKCRCDNKMACIFAMNGWEIYNPFREIKCYHKHNSGIRNYDKLDTSVLGCLGFVHTDCNPDSPSEIEICVMPAKSEKIKKVYLSTWLADTLKTRQS